MAWPRRLIWHPISLCRALNSPNPLSYKEAQPSVHCRVQKRDEFHRYKCSWVEGKVGHLLRDDDVLLKSPCVVCPGLDYRSSRELALAYFSLHSSSIFYIKCSSFKLISVLQKSKEVILSHFLPILLEIYVKNQRIYKITPRPFVPRSSYLQNCAQQQWFLPLEDEFGGPLLRL